MAPPAVFFFPLGEGRKAGHEQGKTAGGTNNKRTDVNKQKNKNPKNTENFKKWGKT